MQRVPDELLPPLQMDDEPVGWMESSFQRLSEIPFVGILVACIFWALLAIALFFFAVKPAMAEGDPAAPGDHGTRVDHVAVQQADIDDQALWPYDAVRNRASVDPRGK